MLSCDLCEQYMVDALYASLEAAEENELEVHLDQCALCRALMEEMHAATDQLRRHDSLSQESMVEVANSRSIDSRSMENLWESLQPSLNAIDADRFRSTTRKGFSARFISALAIAASLVLTIALVFSVMNDQASNSNSQLATLIHPDLINYLNRAEVMLMLVANAESDVVSAIPIRNSVARGMALEANFLSTSMEDSFNTGQHRLLSDIEFLLLQIANLDESNMADGVALLQQYLEENSVLFKIRLLEMRNQQSVI